MNELGALDRRMAIWHTLCIRHRITIRELAEIHHVCPRTIRYDIEKLSIIYPIETACGRYTGGIKLADWYIPEKDLITEEEMSFLIGLLPTLDEHDALRLKSIIHKLTQ